MNALASTPMLQPLPLIPAKFAAPAVHRGLLARPRFDEWLQRLPQVRLAVLQAPSGFGKTVLASQWAQDFLGAVAWLNLDGNDNQPRQFGRYLVNALDRQLEAGCPQAVARAELGEEGPESLLTRLLAELPAEHAPLLLVLDGFEQLRNAEVIQALRFFLRNMPEWLTLLVCSRGLPDLGVAEWRVKQQLLAVDAVQLAFEHDEVQSLLELGLPFAINREQIERLNRRIGGWPCALQLAVQEVQTGRGMDLFLESLQLGHPYIRDYLREQVLAGLGEATQDFLYSTCLLERFSAALADRLTATCNGREMLEQLERSGLFIQPVDGLRQWFAYHPLFASFLKGELRTHQAPRIAELHLRAAEALLEERMAEEAAEHAVLANHPQRVEEILVNHGRQFYRQGRLELLQQCLQVLPENRVAESPLFTLLQAWSSQNQYQCDQVERWLQAGEAAQKGQYSPEQWVRIEADFKAVRAQVAINQGNQQQAMALAREALAFEPLTMRTSKVAAMSVLAEAHFVQGDLQQAQQLHEDTVRRAQQINAAHPVLWSLGQLSEIAIAQGHLQKAYNLQERALQYIEQEKLPLTPIMEFIHRVRGQVLLEWHHLDAVEQCALQGLELLDRVGDHWFLQCYVLLARVAHARGQQSVCADYVGKLKSLLAADDYHIDWQANAHGVMLSYWESTEDKDSIRQWLSTAPPLKPGANHFAQGNARNHVLAYLALNQAERGLPILRQLQIDAERHQLVMDQNRNHILQAMLYWQREERQSSLDHLHKAMTLASGTGAIGSFLRLGKPLIAMLKSLQHERQLDELERQRADRLIQLAQQQRDFSRAIRITLDEAVIQDIINRPDVPELIRHSPLTRREWQVLSLIHAGLSNEQISEHLNVAPTTIKTHIRSLYQKLNITQRSEAVQLARSLLSKIQGE
ncbi:HTH-type transcriptional regulator MalT [Pseudomonas sp. LPB0260]|uniref:HTH-type transcriptional regulator MalT n=1 Tax=Pseudomonas sp. LPB0260 TaxID=2614442 RepID=UPI0015C25AAC|nr:HTH-type transcriptional regulator MalT [Pseudomonas sp. LPB0260]QLC72101.1 HTH-type transcriptional regulator MalT [Pseudomonas sp. LPB0260]QLC74879.1 HTH-type transcriptional regulator MalT [Pseudomonas sp. LPB0260]